MKLKNAIICLLPLLLLTLSGIAQEARLFEGTIEYYMEYKPIGPNVSEARLKEVLGSKMVMQYRKGQYRQTYYNNYGKIVKESFFNTKTTVFYTKYAGNDTLYAYNPSKVEGLGELIQLKKVGEEKVLNETVDDYLIEYKQSTPLGEESTVKMHYIVSRILLFNPKHFEKWNDGYFNKLMELTSGIRLKMVYTGEYYTEYMTATKVTEEKVKAKDLKFDLKKYVVKES